MSTTSPDPQRPLWLLDVDGVVNAVVKRPDRGVWRDWRRGTASADGVEWPIWFSPTVAGTVARLHSTGVVEVRWLTTWGAQANGELRALLGMPELEVAGEPPHVTSADGAGSHGEAVARAESAAEPDDEPSAWWKLEAVQRIVQREPDRPVIWTDDDLSGERDAVAWVERNVPRRLLLSPRPNLGLTPRQLRAIRSYCGDWAQ
jgi:hypothetical protein